MPEAVNGAPSHVLHRSRSKLPHFTSMSIRQFAYVLDLLDEHCVVLPATALVEERPTASHRHTVVISFDDGYAATLQAVLPLLAARGLTAAIFVVTVRLVRS